MMSSDAVEPVADHSRAGPLTGVRVLDFTERMQGPYGTQMLGDLGAEVIKVERRQALTPDGRPDERYGAHGQYGKTAEDSTFYPAGFLSANRNKKSITIDLKNEQGKTVVRRLVELSDVVFENFRPAVMTRLGFGYEQCAEINPSIVYASASGYGPDGPYDKRPGQDRARPGDRRARRDQRLGHWPADPDRHVHHRCHGRHERWDRRPSCPLPPPANG